MSGRQKGAVAVLLFLFLLPVWIFPFFPSQDGPSHLYNTVIFSELLSNPNTFFSKFYEINWHLFPNWAFTIIAVLLCPFFSILTVEKIILSLYLAGFVCAVFYLFRSISAEKTVLGFGSFLFVYNWFLLMGFYNFCLSIPLALFSLGYGIRNRGALRAPRLVVFSLLFTALYLSHVVSFGLTVLVLVFLMAGFGEKRTRALTGLGLAILPASLLFIIHSLGRGKGPEPAFHAPLGWLAANTLSLRIGPWFHPLEWVWLTALWLVLGLWLGQTLKPRARTSSQRR